MVEDIERCKVGGADRPIADGCSRGEGDCAAGEEVGTENGARHKIVMGEVVFSLVVVD